MSVILGPMAEEIGGRLQSERRRCDSDSDLQRDVAQRQSARLGAARAGFRHAPSRPCGGSSVGQNACLPSRRSRVRVPLATPRRVGPVARTSGSQPEDHGFDPRTRYREIGSLGFFAFSRGRVDLHWGNSVHGWVIRRSAASISLHCHVAQRQRNSLLRRWLEVRILPWQP